MQLQQHESEEQTQIQAVLKGSNKIARGDDSSVLFLLCRKEILKFSGNFKGKLKLLQYAY